MNINEFKKGDEIVRTKPAKSIGGTMFNPLSGETIERVGDRSYMGEKMIFAGIANGQIYVQRTDALDMKLFGDKLIDLSLDLWSEDWEIWVDPTSLKENIQPKADLEAQIKEAIKVEDYELAERLKKKLSE